MIMQTWGRTISFLENMKKEYTIRLSKDEEKIVGIYIKKLSDGKRIHELVLLKKFIGKIHTV